jgi:methionyl-tRNA synthetase
VPALDDPALDEAAARRSLVICGPPTANGDLHVGHVAGPYVGADVHVRYLRAVGRDAVFASCTDDYQTYTVTTATRLGTTPPELVAKSAEQIQGTFEAMGIHLDGFSATDDGYKAAVYDYWGRLHAAGKLRLRKVRLPYGERSGRFLVEGFIGGDCPTCLADSRGGFCEGCGHPIDFDGLLEPYSILDKGEPITYREVEILVFPVEEYREQLRAYYKDKTPGWRPHLVTLMHELLERPWPDYPVTYPLEWGLPALFPETPGQTLNAWIEGMPASMYCSAYAERKMGLDAPGHDDAWRAGRGARPIVFMGFDPLYVWALVHVAELIAHGDRYELTDTFLVNEFYELENEKFSTSKGHLVWARDLVAEVPRDVARFYLALSAPEHARTSFSRAVLDKIAGERLVEPWNELAVLLGKLTAEAGGGEGLLLPVSPQTPGQTAAMVGRFSLCYELESFSLGRAADLVVQYLERIRGQAHRASAQGLDRDELRLRLGDLFLQLRALVCCASPILIDLAAEAARAGGFELRMSASDFAVSHTAPFPVPGLALRVATSTD